MLWCYMTRYTITRIILLNEKIDELRDRSARIRARLTDPVRLSIDESKGSRSRDPRRRERLLTDGIDAAREIDARADELQKELDALNEELLNALQSVDWYTRVIVKGRLIKRWRWYDIADITGYSERTCSEKFKSYIDKLT